MKFFHVPYAMALALTTLATTVVSAQDCNRNGVADRLDIAAERSLDCNDNEIPDECDLGQVPRFAEARRFDSSEELRLGRTVPFDVDLDGDVDVVVVGRFGSLGVLINEGGALDPRRLPQVTGHIDNGALAADLNGDGLADLAILYGRSSKLAVLFNRGAGSFAEAESISVAGALSLAVADTDGDGDPDLVTDREVLMNDGNGVFATAVAHAGVTAIRVADLDGDGDADLVDPLDTISNRGDGTFDDPVSHGGQGTLVDVIDFDGDGDPDIVLESQLVLHWLSNRGDGTFEDPQPLIPFASAGSPPVLADFEGDGDLDVFRTYFPTAVESTSLSVFLNEGRLEFWEAAHTVLPRRAFPRIELVDFDGDGLLDVFASESQSRRVTLLSLRTDPFSVDENGNGVPDECELPFRRGDANADSEPNLADAVFLLNHLFLQAEPLACTKSADVDDSGTLDLTDAVALLNFLFLGGRSPGEPFVECGSDPSRDALSCLAYPAC